MLTASSSTDDDRPIAYPVAASGLDVFTLDRNLRRLLARRAPAILERHGRRLAEFGIWAGGPLDAQADYTDRHAPPRLETHDRPGAATGRVILTPAYAEAHADTYRRGVRGLDFGPDRAPPLPSLLSEQSAVGTEGV